MEQPGYTSPEAQRGLGLQCLIAASYGLLSLGVFSFVRTRWPRIYSPRTVADPDIPKLRSTLFGWLVDLVRMSDRTVLQFAGLDAYVYLMFFKAAVSMLMKMTVFYYLVIAPLRWYYLGQFDDPVDEQLRSPNLFGLYIWVYVVSTSFFTVICLHTMRRYTSRVVNTRQAYMGHQNSITDRTIRISGIPRKLRSRDALQQYLTLLFSVAPENIVLLRRWTALDTLWKRRTQVINKLEQLYSQYVGLHNDELFRTVIDESSFAPFTDNTDSELNSFVDELDPSQVWNNTESGGVRAVLSRLFPNCVRPESKEHGDQIDHYTGILAGIDAEITKARAANGSTPVTNMAFVTMESAAHCQVAAQTIMSPSPHTMVSSLAPSPPDVVWSNVYLKSKQRATYNYVITLIVLVTNAFLAVPLSYLARLLDLTIISNHFPVLGQWLSDHQWMAAFVTDVLPTYVFASFNLFVPYVFSWLSKRQGFVSKSDIELSTVSKNFFYVFVNLFLVFTIESTLFNFSVDEFAKRFAHSLIRLSSFYTNLIVLQAIGIMPIKLLQIGNVAAFPFLSAKCRTARDVYNIYKPHRINYGLVLPNSMFIFLVVLTYSTLRGRILFFGTVYFAVSYIVYKYQLMYTLVHQQHSSARLWTLIVRRMYLAVGVFHLAIIGVLVLQSAYILALLILPLTVLLLGVWYDFEHYTRPLLEFVAVEAQHQSEIDFNDLATYRNPHSNVESALQRQINTETEDDRGDEEEDAGEAEGYWENGVDHAVTIDEIRERDMSYENTNLRKPLDGPWIATSGFRCIVANPEGLVVREIPKTMWI